MAQCLVPSWIKSNMWQITWIFLPSYSSSICLFSHFLLLNIVIPKYCDCFRQILYQILYHYFQDCHHITCTNAFEGQSWKQACLCLSLDCLLWLTIKPVNNILVKSWNTYLSIYHLNFMFAVFPRQPRREGGGYKLPPSTTNIHCFFLAHTFISGSLACGRMS